VSRVYLQLFGIVKMPVKKEKQISFRAEPDLAQQLDLWAANEDIPVADLVRKMLRVAAVLYERHGSLHALRQLSEAGATVVPSSHSQAHESHITKELRPAPALGDNSSTSAGQQLLHQLSEAQARVLSPSRKQKQSHRLSEERKSKDKPTGTE
jgi:hypothetical protein